MQTALEPHAPLPAAAPAEPSAFTDHDDDDDVDAGSTTFSDTAAGRVGCSHLQLSGLYCSGCATSIEHALRGERGVLQADVSFASQRATVRWDPALTTLPALVAAIVRAGYGAVPDAAAPARAMRRTEERRMLWRLFVAVFCMMQVMMYQAPLYVAEPGTLTADLRMLLLWAAWLLSIPVVVFSAAPFFRDAREGLKQRRISMDVPVSIGIVLAFVASTGATFDPGGLFGADAYFDSLTMFVAFLLGGRLLALKMRNRAAATLEAAVSRTPARVRRIDADGSTTLVSPHRLRVGDRVHVLAGESFAADGRIVAGFTEVDEALLTGESRPVAKAVGDEAIAGSINLLGAVIQRVDRLGADTRYEGIVALMRGALADRPALLRGADRIAGPFLWAVLLCAAAAAAAWSLIDPSRAIPVAVAVLIVTCPCALSLAAPSALLAAAGAMARRGLLVQRLDAIEALARIDTVCFDKTGTLTEARLGLGRIEVGDGARCAGLDENALRTIAASLARQSTHPIAEALAAAPGAMPCAEPRWRSTREASGQGIEGTTLEGDRYRLGARAWATGRAQADAPRSEPSDAGPETWLGDASGGALARFGFVEALRDDATASIDALRQTGLSLHLLSGDRRERVEEVATRLGIGHATGEARPADKLAAVAALQAAGHRVAMVGDGINDAPVMARADVSFAVGQGTALARAKADVALPSGSLADLVFAHALARRTLRIVRQNLAWAILYNAACLPLAIVGAFPPWAAGLGMAASSLLVVLNSLRVDPQGHRGAASGSAIP